MDDIKKNLQTTEYPLIKISANEINKFFSDFTHIHIQLLILYPYIKVPQTVHII